MSHSSYRTGSQFKTLIYQQELDYIAGWVEEYPELETGGDLFGFWTHSGFPVVQLVLGPGQMSQHNRTSFYQDRDHLIKSGEILRNKHGLQHIGEWHSHHQMALAQPSGGDEQTVFNALRRYDFPKFLLCIANLNPTTERYARGKYRVNVGCFLFNALSSHYQTGAWVVLPDQSPIRKDVEYGEHRTLFKRPTIPRNNWNVEQTTLDAQSLVVTEPIVISENIWYSTPQGKALLKEIFDAFESLDQNREMIRTPPSEDIYFTFYHKYKGVSQKWQVYLPPSFPKDSPRIKVGGESFPVKDWDGQWNPVQQIEACIKRWENRCRY
ncbi:Mov34/MPN/PAD-1 family protein [Spirulina subsalsa]|nr:Mov34/MPN/PAD-1 family protein [Spirulina subsalsa]